MTLASFRSRLRGFSMRHVLLIPVIAALAGCGSELVPGVAVEGTTAMVAIPMEFEVGYGRRLSSGPGIDPELSPTLPYASRVHQGTDEDWVGWGNPAAAGSISQRIPITIVDALDTAGQETPHYTAKQAWGPYFGQIASIYAEGNLRDAVPQPEFRVQVPDATSPPHAWNLSIEFPAERIEIAAVRLIRGNPSGGYVGWNATASPTSDAPRPCPGRSTSTWPTRIS